MKPVNSVFAAAACSLAALGTSAAQAAGVELLNEGFGNVNGLSGWTQVNNSAPPGSGWFQGNAALFPARSGAADSYAAVNFLGADNGIGTVDNWLITPALDLSGATTLRFFTLNYVGLDTVSVVTAVPKPSTWAMLGMGLGLLGLPSLLRRKPQA